MFILKLALSSNSEPQTEQERQAVIQYEHWLMTNAQYLGMNVKDLETSVAKSRKAKKALAAKRRQVEYQELIHLLFENAYSNRSK